MQVKTASSITKRLFNKLHIIMLKWIYLKVRMWMLPQKYKQIVKKPDTKSI